MLIIFRTHTKHILRNYIRITQQSNANNTLLGIIELLCMFLDGVLLLLFSVYRRRATCHLIISRRVMLTRGRHVGCDMRLCGMVCLYYVVCYCGWCDHRAINRERSLFGLGVFINTRPASRKLGYTTIITRVLMHEHCLFV